MSPDRSPAQETLLEIDVSESVFAGNVASSCGGVALLKGDLWPEVQVTLVDSEFRDTQAALGSVLEADVVSTLDLQIRGGTFTGNEAFSSDTVGSHDPFCGLFQDQLPNQSPPFLPIKPASDAR